MQLLFSKRFMSWAPLGLPRPKGLRLQLMGWVLAVTLPLMVLAVMGLAFYTARQNQSESAARLAQQTTDLSQNVTRWQESMEMMLHYVAAQPSIVSMDPQRQTPTLRSLVHNYRWIHYAHITAPTGVNIARGDDEPLQNYRDRTWFQQAMLGTISHQTLATSRSTGKPALNMAVPIRDAGGQVVGVLAFGVDLQSLSSKAGTATFGKTGYLLLVDEHGLALGRPGLSSNSKLEDLSAFPPVRRLLNKNGAGLLEFTDPHGERWLSFGQPTLYGWSVVALQKHSEVMVPVYRTIWVDFGLVLLSGLASFAAIWIVVGTMVLPVRRLTHAAQQVAAGDWGHSVPIGQSAELVSLGQAFNDMIAILKERHEALEAARREAELANHAKSQFLSTMSHELRTPLTSILGYADLLKDETRNQPASLDKVEIIRRDGRHLLTLINDILDLSKIEAGKMTVERIATSPCATIAEVLSMMRVRATEKHLNLAVEYLWPMPEMIQTDPIRLRQILVNLIGNALKFTQTGGVRLIVRPPRPSDAHPQMTFEVLDTGIGIPPEHLQNLFAPFIQGDASTTRRFGGTGLGLMISRSLARLLGGDISVASTPDSGSTFLLSIETGALAGVAWLTNAQEALAKRTSSQTPAPTENATPNALRGMEVLLAEDTPSIRQLVTEVLTQNGAHVEAVENGLLACEKFLAGKNAGPPFDAIVLDMQMPELDGYGAARQLRTAGFAGPIVAMTANAMKEDRQRCLDSGCTAYVSKPLDLRELINVVAEGRQGPCPDLPTEPSPAPNPAPNPDRPLQSTATDPIIRKWLCDFLARLPSQVTEMESLLAHGDLPGLRHVLHQIKGTGGMFGYAALTDSARRAEDAAQQANLQLLRREVLDLIGLIQSVHGYEPSTPHHLTPGNISPS